MSEMNRDEALRCLEISKTKYRSGETAAALKFANKSLALCETAEAKSWITFLNTQPTESPAASSSTGPKLRPTKSTPNMGESARSSADSDSAPSRPFTPEQAAGIKRIRAFKAKGDLYGILGLEKSCTDSDIKKAYRKMALQYHPDKCGAPGTDEAFKAISHAFTVLGTQDKRDAYDRYGVDTDTRSGAATAARGGGGGFRGFDGTRFESEISPEDLFRMFMGGDDFPGFGFQAGPGFRTHSFNSSRARAARAQQHHQQQQRHRQQQQGGEGFSLLPFLQILPLILLLLFTLLSAIGSSPDPYSFEQTPDYYTDRRLSKPHGVTYFVNRNDFKQQYPTAERQRVLDQTVEHQYLRNIERACSQEQESQRLRVSQAYSLFGVNKVALDRARRMRLHNCERLSEWHQKPATAFSSGGSDREEL
ncbi:hypothetical protein BC831DRAFT_468017 [Entophlyctis helioformis]|nr:hypothetical protein BC831DRAFT_468017 [Entophlyctis helioformis]